MKNKGRTPLQWQSREEMLDEVAMVIFEVIKSNGLTFLEAEGVLQECEYLIKERKIG